MFAGKGEEELVTLTEREDVAVLIAKELAARGADLALADINLAGALTCLGDFDEALRIYARARSDYIHPLFGLEGETLTKDWSTDHPHHRGIYWAWPEVDWRGQRGDLHALQHVFARPTGKCIITLARSPVPKLLGHAVI